MIPLPDRRIFICAAAALALSTPLAAQDEAETAPPPLPAPAPAPTASPTATSEEPSGAPGSAPDLSTPAPSPTPLPLRLPVPGLAPAATPTPPSADDARPAPATAASSAAPGDPLALPDDLVALPPIPDPAIPAPAPPPAMPAPGITAPAVTAAPLTNWGLWAAGGLAALAVLAGGAALWRRRRRSRPLRLAAPASLPPRRASKAEAEPVRLDLALEITGAVRSVMMVTLDYRLTIANRSARAASALNLGVQLVCARASADGGAAKPGIAQSLDQIARIGPHQSRSITGQVQLPVSAIRPLRQGQVPLFVPLVHVTIEGEGQTALTHSFVVGTPSAAGRLHPIPLDTPPGTIAGLAAQIVAAPKPA